MENMEPIESNSDYQEIKGETPSPISLKSFHILSDKRNEFLITLETEKDLLIITACDNKFIKNYYKEKFSLQYLRKYFGHNPDIEKCSSEIIKITSQKKGIIRELKSVIELKIPLNSKEHLEISFLLKKIEKSNSEKFEQLYELINQIRSKQHEYDNRIATLSALPTVHKDYDSLVNSLATYTNFIKSDDKLLDILHINNKIIASFLFYKYKEFDRADKTLNLNIKNQSIKSHLSEPLLVDMLGILIDNMFEAIDPGDSCELIIDNNAGKTIIETKNKGCELTHDIQANLFRRGYSTKTKDNSESTIRGYGLYNLRKILLKNKGSFEVYNEYSSDKKNVFIIFHIEV